MSYFSKIISGELEGASLLVIDEKEIYLDLSFYVLPENGYGFLQDDMYVYCVNWNDKEYCSSNTTKIPILYFYNANLYDVPFSSCQRIEYTSATLVKLMCTYKTSNSDADAFINDVFSVGDITISFSGNKVFNEQQNKYYESFNPVIIVDSPELLEPNQVWKYVQAINDFLRLVFFEKRIALPYIKLADENEQYLPFRVVENDSYAQYYQSGFYDVYDRLKDHISLIFDYVLAHQLESSFFEQYYICENMQSLFINTYSNFDKLSQKLYGVADKNEDFEKFKDKVWEIIKQDEDYENVRGNIEGLKDKIMSHGTQVGHKQKLKNAFFDILKVIPERASNYDMYDEEIINRIYDLRTDIIHKGKIIEFTGRDVWCLEKFQWITYIILLRKIGIDDGVLEDWMNRVMGVG